VQAVKQLVQAQAENKPADVIGAFASACSAHEDKAHDALMSNCWGVLKDITSGKAPAGGDQREGLLEVGEGWGGAGCGVVGGGRGMLIWMVGPVLQVADAGAGVDAGIIHL
jgi:hypothetical protein